MEINQPKCEQCPLLTFTSLRGLKLHVRATHFKDSNSTRTCVFCEKLFPLPCQLKPHLQVHTEEKPYFCKVCPEELSNKRYLGIHVKLHHSEKKPTFQCEICKKNFKSKIGLSSHTRVHNAKKEYSCVVCSRRFMKETSYREHLLWHTQNKKGFKCQECPLTFVSEVLLDQHNTRCHRGKYDPRFPCIFCLRKCQSKPVLQIHLRSHTMERPFMCRVCPEEFANIANLKRHFVIHDEKRIASFSCNLCPKRCFNKVALQKHTECHTSDRPFQCKTCMKCFRKQYKLARHEITHTGIRPHVCQFCGKRFSDSDSLKDHIRSHTNEKPYKCQFCSKSFNLSGNRLRHERNTCGPIGNSKR